MYRKHWPTISIILLAILIPVAVFFIGDILFSKHFRETENGFTANKIIWKNKAGDTVSSIRLTADQLALIETRLKDSIAKVYGTREKKLLEIIQANQVTTVTVDPEPGPVEKDYDPDPARTDCPPVVRNFRKSFRNPYYSIDVQLGEKNLLSLTSYDTLSVVWKRVNTGTIFNRKKLIQLDISNANPFVRTTSVRAYKVPESKPKRAGVGVQLGYGFSGTLLKPQPYIGLGLSYNIIRF